MIGNFRRNIIKTQGENADEYGEMVGEGISEVIDRFNSKEEIDPEHGQAQLDMLKTFIQDIASDRRKSQAFVKGLLRDMETRHLFSEKSETSIFSNLSEKE